MFSSICFLLYDCKKRKQLRISKTVSSSIRRYKLYCLCLYLVTRFALLLNRSKRAPNIKYPYFKTNFNIYSLAGPPVRLFFFHNRTSDFKKVLSLWSTKRISFTHESVQSHYPGQRTSYITGRIP